jgi:uncharacterized membrane protein
MNTFVLKVQNIFARRWTDWFVLASGIVVFAGLAAATITKSSIWFDEAFSTYITRFHFFDIARYTATDVHPPLYYWILKLWEMGFGTSDLAVRSLSVVFGATAIIFGFLLVRRLFGRKAAYLSLLFLILSPMLIRYSQEARMYTLAATITLAATYVLTFAHEAKKRRLWVIYGILVGLGMWTHYFTALVCLAHWVWRCIVLRQKTNKAIKGKKFAAVFFSKNWIVAHIVAIGIFLPWLPFMAYQLGGIQGTSFWIPPVGIDTPTNYLTNVFYYLEHGQVSGWFAALLIGLVVFFIVLVVRLYKSLPKAKRQWYLLLLSIAIVPVVLLFVASLPPLKSSFVERYLIPATLSLMMLMGVTFAIMLPKFKKIWRIVVIVIVVGMMSFGISNVYFYGNYNKSSNVNTKVKQVIAEIAQKGKSGEPIISNSPWVFYEAINYATPEHPVYFVDALTDYIYGSLDMLKDNDQFKIKNLAAFTSEHPVVWYIGVSGADSLTPPASNWKELQHFGIYDVVNKQTLYRATEFIIPTVE